MPTLHGVSDGPDDASSEHLAGPGDGGAAVPDLPDLDSLGAGGDLGDLLAKAQEALAAQAAAAQREVEGVAGGGAVRIRASGTGEVLAVSIAREAVDPDDVAMLEDLVLAALHDVNAQLREIQRDAMGSLSGLDDLFGGEA